MNTLIRQAVPVQPTTRREKISKAMEAVVEKLNVDAGFELDRYNRANDAYTKSKSNADQGLLGLAYRKLSKALAMHNLAKRFYLMAKEGENPHAFGALAAERKGQNNSVEAQLIRLLLVDRNWLALARLSIACVINVSMESPVIDRRLTDAWISVGAFHQTVFQLFAKELSKRSFANTGEFVLTGAAQKTWSTSSQASKIALLGN